MSVKKTLQKEIIKLVERIKKVKKRTIYCIVGGIVFGIVSFFINKNSIYIRPYEIERGMYGTQKQSKNIKIDAENLVEDMEFSIAISPRKYTKKEADTIFEEKIKSLKIQILGVNEDYEHINTKLNFTQDLGNGIRATYNFEPFYDEEKHNVNKTVEKENENVDLATNSSTKEFKYYVKYQNLIDEIGNVKNENFAHNETCDGYIEVQFSTEIKEKEGTYKSEKYIIPIIVISKKLSPIESFKNAFKKAIEKSDRDTIDNDTIMLPNVVDDISIKYKENINLTFLAMPLIGILIAILLDARDKEKIKEEKKKRIRSLEIDFAQIISKILLYVSSGMTIRNSMIRLAEEYQKKLKKGNVEKRVAYDELIIVKNKLASGYSEIKSYEEMAKNIGLRTYTRFLNIIIQSIKNGNKELKNILNMEVQDALYERKQKAKKMGEEAATKLILPLMMMLAIIMIVIMVPAFMGM